MFECPLEFGISGTKRVLILTPEVLQTNAVNTEECFCIREKMSRTALCAVHSRYTFSKCSGWFLGSNSLLTKSSRPIKTELEINCMLPTCQDSTSCDSATLCLMVFRSCWLSASRSCRAKMISSSKALMGEREGKH